MHEFTTDKGLTGVATYPHGRGFVFTH